MSTQLLYSVEEAATSLRMIPKRLARLAKLGEVPCVRLPDGELRFDPQELRQWVESFKTSTKGPSNMEAIQS